jgi:hypothetical protein
MFQDECSNITLEILDALTDDVGEAYFEAVESYVKKMYSIDALNDSNLLYAKPNIRNEISLAKLEKSWPEVPIYDPVSGISGRSDLILNVDGKPCVLDLKTTSLTPSRWDEFLQAPTKVNYELQVNFYGVEMNEQEYYDVKIEKVGIGTVNLLMPAGVEDSEHERYWNLTDEIRDDILNLKSNLARHRNAYLDKTIETCIYSKCREHTKNDETRNTGSS